MKNCIISILIFVVFSCSKKKTEPRIIYAKQLEYDIELLHNDGTRLKKDKKGIEKFEWIQRDKQEVFIIEKNTLSDAELFLLINKNEQNCPINKALTEKKYNNFSRYYYKESDETPINFVEDPGGFAVDILEDHHDDLICEIQMIKNINTNIIEWKNTCEKSE